MTVLISNLEEKDQLRYTGLVYKAHHIYVKFVETWARPDFLISACCTGFKIDR